MARYEDSAEDKRKDAKLAKKAGMTMAQWEKSAADKRMDKVGQKKMNKKRKKAKK